tara:strand:+ start:36 stop:917 length:882 start_codon:yes stop_codon:yes gene_type:complete
MSAETRSTLKSYFNTGDNPTEAEFIDLIDSGLNLTDGGTVAGATTFSTGLNCNSHITASGNISSSGTLIGGGLNINGTTTFNEGHITNVGVISVDVIQADTDGSVELGFGIGGISFNASGGDKVTFNDGAENVDLEYSDENETIIFKIDQSESETSVVGRLDVTGHITASGNISSSDNISAFNYIEATQTIAAAGSDQAGATAIPTAGRTVVTGADNAKGVRLPVVSGIATGTIFTITNSVANKTLEIYPGTNDNIGPTLPDNGAATLPAGGSLIVIKYNANGWMGYFGVAPS